MMVMIDIKSAYQLFLDFLLAVGDGWNHKKVEKYEFDRTSWVSLGEYPFVLVQTI